MQRSPAPHDAIAKAAATAVQPAEAAGIAGAGGFEDDRLAAC